MREEDRDRVARQGAAAWKRLKQAKNWNDWVQVGEALVIGREWAMHQSGKNEPEGKGYIMAFTEWLERYKLDDMDKSDRAKLFKVMDALTMITEWRATLTLTDRLKLNHPSTVWRKFEASRMPDPERSKPARTGLKDSVAELSEANAQLTQENAQLKAHIAELEAARTVTPDPDADKPLTGAERSKAYRERKREPAETARLEARIAELEAAQEVPEGQAVHYAMTIVGRLSPEQRQEFYRELREQ
jgi:BMFP domain-containing protein YqiC